MIPVFDHLGKPIRSREELDALMGRPGGGDSSRYLYDADGYAIPTYDWPAEFQGEPLDFEPSDEDRRAAAEMFARPVPTDLPSLLDAVRDFLESLGLRPDRQHDSVGVEVGGRLVTLDATDLDAMAAALEPVEPPADRPAAPTAGHRLIDLIETQRARGQFPARDRHAPAALQCIAKALYGPNPYA